MSRKSNLDAKVAEIIKIASQDLPAIMKTGCNNEIEKQVQVLRYNMDDLMIQVAFGVNFTPGKTENEPKVHWNQKLPSKLQISMISDALQKYIDDIEIPYYTKRHLQAKNNKNQQTDDSDMSIPDQGNVDYVVNYPVIPTFEKATKKDMKTVLFTQGMIQKYLNVPAFLALCAMGEEIRRKQNITTAIIIGSVTIGLTGAAIAGAAYHNHKKNEFDDDLDGIDVDVNEEIRIDIDSPVGLLSDDTPVRVEIA